MSYALNKKRVWVTGHNGMVGKAIVRRLSNEDCEIITVPKSELDLREGESVSKWMKKTKPEAVFIAAAKVGGIHANSHYPAEFLYDNLMIAANIIHNARINDVEKSLFWVRHVYIREMHSNLSMRTHY